MKKIGMAVVVHNGKILIAQRKKTMKQGGLWEFPGGKIEPGETPVQCIQREFMEELGMTVHVGKYLNEMNYTYQGLDDFHFDTYWGTCDNPTPAKLDAHEQIAWVSQSELDNYEFCPADKPLVKELKTMTLPD
ncbi:MAG: (deoxy)nucleoside triphosphate pyrophosphohydrolase [Alphaproteobacteria bacterium]|nr:(deoxy)nucleoside triphosphate pyrophosphohydrolase [Alphaproteobacteria bacterium]